MWSSEKKELSTLEVIQSAQYRDEWRNACPCCRRGNQSDVALKEEEHLLFDMRTVLRLTVEMSYELSCVASWTADLHGRLIRKIFPDTKPYGWDIYMSVNVSRIDSRPQIRTPLLHSIPESLNGNLTLADSGRAVSRSPHKQTSSAVRSQATALLYNTSSHVIDGQQARTVGSVLHVSINTDNSIPRHVWSANPRHSVEHRQNKQLAFSAPTNRLERIPLGAARSILEHSLIILMLLRGTR